MKLESYAIPTLLALSALAETSSAQTVTVTMTDDVVDFAGAQQVADLPGPDGLVSFREACTAANNTPGPQTIAFDIPNAPPMEWSNGVAILFMDFNTFLLSDDETTVDFSTQTASTGDTNPDGNEVGIRTAPITGAPAIHVSGNYCTVKGLDRVSYCGYGVQLAGNHNRVIGCTISGPLYGGVYISGGFGGPPASYNVVGGSLPGEGNTLSSGNDGVRIDAPADNNVVVGNVLTGTYNGAAVRGSIYSTFPNNNRIGGPTTAERNIIAGAGRYGEEGFPVGAQVKVEHASGTIVEGNYIGTTADGTAPNSSQRGPVGVSVIDSTGTTVRGNTISGIRVVGVNHYAGQVFGDGIRVTTINGPTANTTIEDNLIGTDPAGNAPVPNLYGVRIAPFISSYPTAATIVSANTIAFNERSGLVVASSITGVRISGNTTFGNGQLGIDLLGPGGSAGVTFNDPFDADTGGNGLQNHPDLASATSAGPSVYVTGNLHSEPLAPYTIEFFASPECDVSGFGQGQVFLGAASAVTDAAGDADFDVFLPGTVPDGWVVTSTATHEPIGSTSEFSACTTIATGPGPGIPVCPGDGSGTPCPCGNDSPDPGEGCVHSGGVGMTITGSGTTSISADDLTLTVDNAPVNNTGIFYSGRTDLSPGNVLYDGLQCTGGDVRRFQGRFQAIGTVSDTGFVSQDPTGTYFVPGFSYRFQYWSRDVTASSPCGTNANFSPAYAVVMAP